VNTVNCLPVCRALSATRMAGKVKLVATDLFAEMSSFLRQGTVTASIYQHPHRQGQAAVRAMVDCLANKVKLPPRIHFSPGVVMASNLHLFREMRLSEPKLELPDTDS
jgi:LacI family transcriptional regulator